MRQVDLVDWNEVLQWSQKVFIASCALAMELLLSAAVGVQAHSHPAQHHIPSPNIQTVPAIRR